VNGLRNRGVVGTETCDAAGRSDAAILHVSNEDLDSRRKAVDERTNRAQLSPNADAETIVYQQRNLRLVSGDRSDAGDGSVTVVDFHRDIGGGGCEGGLGVDGDDGLGGERALLLRLSDGGSE
jgi:hypothetical protein